LRSALGGIISLQSAQQEFNASLNIKILSNFARNRNIKLSCLFYDKYDLFPGKEAGRGESLLRQEFFASIWIALFFP